MGGEAVQLDAGWAAAWPGPVTMLTSDPEDLVALCGRQVTLVKI
jgi:hypothetical protein